MHLHQSKHPIEGFLEIARTGKLPFPGFEDVPVDIFWAAPDEPVEIWDRVLETFANLHQTTIVASEWAGVRPTFHRDSRQYRKTIQTDAGRFRLTISSSQYLMRPVSAILQGRCVGCITSKEMTRFRLIICDTDNRSRCPAFIEEDISFLEEEAEQEIPEEENKRVLVGAR